MTKKDIIPNRFDPLTILIEESDSFQTIERMEQLVEVGHNLSSLAIQPIYLALKKLPAQKVGQYLSMFSKEQREVFLDIDLWHKDTIDIEYFSFWIDAYGHSPTESIRNEFVQSEQFLLYLKSRFNVWTFDSEDPNYPDHDNYFLTDDTLLLFEFDETFNQVDEARELIRNLYSLWGVERAYTFLFKMVSDSFSIIEEESYQIRKERMRDFGFVDYMEALEMENPFINIDFLNLFIKKKTAVTGNLDDIAKNQNLHNSSLIAFKEKFEDVTNELRKLTNQKRSDFIQFNFVRLINARLESEGSLKKGSLSMTRTGAQTKNLIQLGFNYIVESGHLPEVGEDGLFGLFNFSELYKIGNSLIKFNLKELKKALHHHGFENEVENFLGDYWCDFLDNSFDTPTKFHKVGKDKAQAVIEFIDYEMWIYKSKTLIALMPFAKKFYDAFSELKNDGRLQDDYYLNYSVEDINFEALLLSNFANFYLNSFFEEKESSKGAKLGLTIEEYKVFYRGMISETSGEFNLSPELFKKIKAFSDSFGLSNVYDFNSYLQDLLKTQLEGYEIEELKDEDFKHVGGPIILTIKQH